MKIGGSIIGNFSQNAVISALGHPSATATSDLAIAGLSVGGRVEDADIYAGFTVNGEYDPTSADAQIGAVSIGGDWNNSNLLAGVHEIGSTFSKISDSHDNSKITSSIASITIGGQVLGPSGGLVVETGFSAEWIKSFSVGGTKLTLKSGAHNDDFNIGASGDVTFEEV